VPQTLDLLEQLLGEVPEYDRFWTVDEQIAELNALAETHPALSTLTRIGTSQLGEALWCLRIEGGPRHAICFGSPHPNEPIGCLSALHLARTLCADPALRGRLGMTWHLIPCADPDGMRLNEGWFRVPLTRTNFGRHFYRPAPSEQVEWTFPVAYKDLYFDRSLPETQALMRLIDELRPALLCPLHNSELGGAYYYLSRPAPELYPILHDLARQCSIPLDLGEPEMPYIEPYAPAIFRMSSPQDAYEFAVRMNVDPLERASGGSSTSYAGRWGTFSIVSETPYWTHREAADRTPTSTSYREVLRRRGEALKALSEDLVEVFTEVRADLVGGRPFALAVDEFGGSLGRMGVADLRRSGESQAQRAATVAERFSCADLVHCFRLRYGGMLARLLDGQLAIGNGTPPIRRHQRRFAAVYAGWCEEAEAATPATPLPIRNTVALQYGAMLAAAAHVAEG
jgi:hypothetical protein